MAGFVKKKNLIFPTKHSCAYETYGNNISAYIFFKMETTTFIGEMNKRLILELQWDITNKETRI